MELKLARDDRDRIMKYYYFLWTAISISFHARSVCEMTGQGFGYIDIISSESPICVCNEKTNLLRILHNAQKRKNCHGRILIFFRSSEKLGLFRNTSGLPGRDGIDCCPPHGGLRADQSAYIPYNVMYIHSSYTRWHHLLCVWPRLELRISEPTCQGGILSSW